METDDLQSITTGITNKLELSEGEHQVLLDAQRGTPITTEDAEDRLSEALHDALQNSENTLLTAPTGLGKTYTIATTPWRDFPEITGGQPIIHISQTTDARDGAVEMSKEAGVKYAVLKARNEVCPVANGDFDRKLPRIQMLTPSEWFDKKCDKERIPFSEAHNYLSKKNKGLPCEATGACSSKTQWHNVPRNQEGEVEYDVIHATSAFAKLGNLTVGSNLIFDERPDYEIEFTQNRLRVAVTQLLHSRRPQATKYDWEDLIKTSQKSNSETEDMEDMPEQYYEKLAGYRGLSEDNLTRKEKFGAKRKTDTLIPSLIRAITNAYEVGNNRFRGQDDLLTVVFDTENTVRQIHEAPDLSKTRCVIGLDAHPSERLWQFNAGIEFQLGELLTSNEQRYWRTNERGLFVVQVGSYTNPLTRGWRASSQEKKANIIIKALREKFGGLFRTCICPKEIKSDISHLMKNAGIVDPELMHYGGEKSLNNFKNEAVGLLLGCVDPGDVGILNNLALLDLFAEPEDAVDKDGNPRIDEEGEPLRAYGRGFVGEDADAAQEFLEDVREVHIAQSIGRYARNIRDTNSGAVVYVWTNAIPQHMIDVKIPGVDLRKATKRDTIADYVYRSDGVFTKRMIVDALAEELGGLSDKHVVDVLAKLSDQDIVFQSKGTGDYGADEYRYIGGTLQPMIDLTIKMK
ncbi:hypothetical protein [Haloplanus natans]|uniref:hypothetical protein n=1 Tax=Haloplanus natans TaxID=376171 RepID=UPI0012F88F5D|nr:hypothetical protein [Haloplanus natans]